MTAHAQVKEDILGRTLEIHLAESDGHGGGVAYSYLVPLSVVVAPGETAPHHIEPLRIKNELAYALYEALRKHFGAAPETATLRADFEHERQRVDKMIEHLLGRPE